MAKIYDLPSIDTPDGTETVPVVRGGATFRARLADLMAGAVALAVGDIPKLISTKPSRPDRLFEFTDRLRRRFGYVENTGTWVLPQVKALRGFWVGKALVRDGVSLGAILQIADPLRRSFFSVGEGLLRVKKVEAHDVTTRRIGGVSLGSYASLMGPAPADVTALAPWQLVPINGQSTAGGAGSSANYGVRGQPNPPVIFPLEDQFGSLMYKSGIVFDGVTVDQSALVPLAERSQETAATGFNEMLMQMLAEDGLSPAKHNMRGIYYAPGQGETALAQFRQGGGLFNRLYQGATSARGLLASASVECLAMLWQQGESDGSNPNYIDPFIAFTAEVDAMMRQTLNQTKPCRTITYQMDRGTGGWWFSEIMRRSALATISGPTYWMEHNGFVGQNEDVVHFGRAGNRLMGAMHAIAWYSMNVRRRPWLPLSLAYDARGNLTSRTDGGSTRMYKLNVPWGGRARLDTSHPIVGSTKQNGIYLFDSAGVEKPIGDTFVVDRDWLAIRGGNEQVGDTLRAGYKSRTDHGPKSLKTCFRDEQGDVIKFRALNNYPMHNWMAGSEKTLTAKDLA